MYLKNAIRVGVACCALILGQIKKTCSINVHKLKM